MASPPAHMIEQGRQEALDAIRRTVAPLGDPVASNSNPLGLPLDANGQATTLRLVTIQGDEVRERRIRCNAFCMFLANRLEYVQAFNRLLQQQQLAVLLLQEQWEDRPHLVKERFLQASSPQHCRVLQIAVSDEGVENTLRRKQTYAIWQNFL